MTTNHHTPIPSTPKQPANAATINGPLSELDAAVTDHETRISAEEAKITLSHVANEFVNSEGECSVPAGTGSSGHIIQEEGVDLTQRAKLNFVGTAVTVTDTPTATEVNITAAAPETTAANDVQVGNGSGAWIKKTLAEFLTIIGKATASGLASLDSSSKVVQDPANATATPTASKIPIADANGLLDGWISVYPRPMFVRCSVVNGDPNPTADYVAQGSLYVFPFGGGNTYQQWNGTSFAAQVLTALTLTMNAAHLSGIVYDLYLWLDGSTVRVVTGPAWASATSRGTGAATAETEVVNGVEVNKVSMTVRNGATTYTMPARYGTVIASICPSANGQVDWSATNRGIQNFYNQLPCELYRCPGYNNDGATTTYPVSSTTFVEANGSNNGRVKFVTGRPTSIRLRAQAFVSSASGYIQIAIGIDTVTNPVEQSHAYGPSAVTSSLESNNKGVAVGIGAHYAALLFASIAGISLPITADLGGSRAGASVDPALTFLTGSLMM